MPDLRALPEEKFVELLRRMGIPESEFFDGLLRECRKTAALAFECEKEDIVPALFPACKVMGIEPAEEAKVERLTISVEVTKDLKPDGSTFSAHYETVGDSLVECLQHWLAERDLHIPFAVQVVRYRYFFGQS